MKTIARLYLASGRKRRLRAINAVIRLLRLIYDVEHDEMRINENLLERFDLEEKAPFSLHKYNAIEEEYLSSEHALGFLESVIDDLEFVY